MKYRGGGSEEELVRMFLGTGKASKSDNEFLMPNAVDWDGSHLWIGEFKFSNSLVKLFS